MPPGYPDCYPGEYLKWDTANLGSLPPGRMLTVGFNETIKSKSDVDDGTVIPFEIQLFEGGRFVREVSASVLVHPNTDTDNNGIPDVYDDQIDHDDDDDGIPDALDSEPLIPANGECTGVSGRVTIAYRTYGSSQTVYCQATVSIATGRVTLSRWRQAPT